MLKREDVLSLGYLKKTQFKGSYRGMRFMLVKEKSAEGEEECLACWVWPEPYAFDHTKESEKRKKEFPFSEEGIEASVEWMNQIHREIADRKTE